jgi:maltooligosyltrehalose synthase
VNQIQKLNSDVDFLDRLVLMQPYKLAYWRCAADEINYRRFFDINDLIAIRMEDPVVFEEAHKWIFKHIKSKRITGMFKVDCNTDSFRITSGSSRWHA